LGIPQQLKKDKSTENSKAEGSPLLFPVLLIEREPTTGNVPVTLPSCHSAENTLHIQTLHNSN
jgi:hypothetical protein